MVFSKGKTLGSSLCKLKQKRSKDQTKNNIYLKQCTSCNSRFIGEYGQTLKQGDIGTNQTLKQRNQEACADYTNTLGTTRAMK